MNKLVINLAAAGLTLATMAGGALGQSYPERPVTLVVPWPAGGGSDTLMRLIAETAGESLGQPIVVVNQPGAGGSLALREVADSEPDGYTMSMIATGFIAEQYGNPNAPVLDEFRVVAFVGTDPAVIAVGGGTGIETLDDLIAAAQAEPGALRNGNDQPGGTSYVAASLMEGVLDIDLTLVPYAGSAPVVQAILAGEVQTATPSITDLIAQHEAGEVTILAVSGAERHFMAEDVPTLTELGYPLVTGTIRALVVPDETPDEVFDVLEAAVLEGLSDEAFLETARTSGFSINPLAGEQAETFLQEMDESMYPVLDEAGLVKVRQK
ncbi:Bug family tripartite tricarboxylate transporter substrate binding protein [Pelagibacterium mangrovi]|uniref:Bug family tripartite tricarboxylate transporter substrate binding protein n=1 Tax=Pelagibacterium mangrovi TaxID=3119828 RepID=UPI002FC6E04B